MAAEMDLMQRLAVSKKIMEKTEQIKRGDVRNITPSVQNFETPHATYNVPEEILNETTVPNKQYHDPSKPLEQERILNSKLPDEIKRLMIEKPIVQPSSMMGSTNISEEVIQGAQRLMNINKNEQPIKNNTTPKQNKIIQESNSSLNITEIKNVIRDIVRDTVRDVVREELKDAGMLVESTTNTNETIQFKVGNTLFVGKVLKIKKMEN